MAQKELLMDVETPAQGMPHETPLPRLQIKKILCPVDFSEFSQRAFHYSAQIARHFQSRLFVQHVVQIPTSAHMEEAGPNAAREASQAELHSIGQKLRRLIEGAGVEPSEVITLLNEGDVRNRILETIQEQRIDLLVMGTHGRKGFNRLVWGSVTERIIHEAICPVLAVSNPQREFVASQVWEPFHLKTILLATDFSHNSDRALAFALKWASELDGKVILFHAVEKIPPAAQGRVDLFPEYNPYFESQIAEAWEKIRMQVPEAVQNWCEVACEVRHGNPKEEIPKVAEEKKADLIVMGARGVGRSTIAWGSNSSGVVRDGRLPVLVARHLPLWIP